MTSILLVEDEESNRSMIARALTRAGHEVTEAENGRYAIFAGSQLRPDVLITDWMLQNSVHGLHVAQTLQLVDPSLRTIVTTGFPSEDLFDRVREFGACALLAKPFRLAELRRTVDRAIETPPGGASPSCQRGKGIGVLEVDRRGSIVFENGEASAILGRVRRRDDENALRDFFRAADLEVLENATERWVEVSPKRNQALRWAIRARIWQGRDSQLFVLCHASDHVSRSDARVKMLLGLGNTCVLRWPFAGRVLVIDGEKDFRRLAVRSLERAGCTCYSAESAELALRMLVTDRGIRYVLLDVVWPNDWTRRTVQSIRSLRPDVQLVGIGDAGHRADLAALGMDRFLPGSWGLEDLIRILKPGVPRDRRVPIARASRPEEVA